LDHAVRIASVIVAGQSCRMKNLLRSTVSTAVAVAFIGVATSALAPPDALSCPARWGESGKPLVTNAETARSIFLVVEKDFFPQADRDSYPAVEAKDEGQRWTVFRWRPPMTLPGGGIEVTHGGGQLELKIAKCDAAISDVHLSR
jgi:hypothetical protein